MNPADARACRWRAVTASFCLAFWACTVSAAERVVVLTGYPQEVFAAFEAAFERANPDVDVEVLWRIPGDALSYLRNEGRGKVDVYWAASYRNFGAHDQPLRPLPSASAPAGFGIDPFADTSAPTLRYDPDLGLRRSALVSALFDQFVTRCHAALVGAWQQLRIARVAAADDPVAGVALDTAEARLAAMPLTAAQADEPALAGIFYRRQRDPSAETRARALEDSWGAFFDDNLAAATRIASGAGRRLARQ